MQNVLQPMQIGPATTDQELKADLAKKLEFVKNKKSAVDEQLKLRKSGTEKSKAAAINKFFEEFRKMGIDLSDPAQLQSFLDSLQKNNPDMYDLFVKIIGYLEHDPASQGQLAPLPEGGPSMGMPQTPGGPPQSSGNPLMQQLASMGGGQPPTQDQSSPLPQDTQPMQPPQQMPQ